MDSVSVGGASKVGPHGERRSSRAEHQLDGFAMGCGRGISKEGKISWACVCRVQTRSREVMVADVELEPGRLQPAAGISLPDRGGPSGEGSGKGTRHDEAAGEINLPGKIKN